MSLMRKYTAVQNKLVMPFALWAALRAFKIAPGDFVAGIPRLKSLDYRIHPCILPLRASRWLFKSAPGRFSPAKNMPE
jgi:hypothetical protein